MAAPIGQFEISKTFSNVLLSNIDAQPDTDGIPFELSTALEKQQGRVQDGQGNASPLYVSESDIQVSVIPQNPESVARYQEVLEGITYAQTCSLIYG
jgi:hypothetical protein